MILNRNFSTTQFSESILDINRLGYLGVTNKVEKFQLQLLVVTRKYYQTRK
jgi:hypothetical protein